MLARIMDRTTRLGVAVAAALVLALTGCGGGSAPGADPSSSGTSASSEAPSEDVSTSPSVPPATGEVMELPDATMNAPQGWSIEKQDLGHLWEARSPDAMMSIYFSQVDGSVVSLDHLLEVGALNAFDGKPRLSFDAELGGQPAFRAVGTDLVSTRVAYGGVNDGPATGDSVGVVVEFSPFESVPKREWQRVLDSALASFRWR